MLKCHVDSKGFFGCYVSHGTSLFILYKNLKREKEEGNMCKRYGGRPLDLPRSPKWHGGGKLLFRINVALVRGTLQKRGTSSAMCHAEALA